MRTGELVATYSELNRVCLRDKQAHLLRVWYWQRHLDVGGKGWFFKDEFLSNIESLGLTSKRAEQILSDGMNIFWRESVDVICMVALGKLNESIRIDTSEGFRVFIPSAVFDNLQTFKAYIYASWFARSSWREFFIDENKTAVPAGGKTISRIALEKLFGITRQTMRTYEEITSMWVKEQIAVFKINNVATDVEHIPFTENTLDGRSGGVWLADVDNDGQNELLRQIPNRYTTELETVGHRNRIRTDGSSSYRGANPTQLFSKSYFNDETTAVKAVSADKTRTGVAYITTTTTVNSRGKTLNVCKTIYSM